MRPLVVVAAAPAAAAAAAFVSATKFAASLERSRCANSGQKLRVQFATWKVNWINHPLIWPPNGLVCAPRPERHGSWPGQRRAGERRQSLLAANSSSSAASSSGAQSRPRGGERSPLLGQPLANNDKRSTHSSARTRASGAEFPLCASLVSTRSVCRMQMELAPAS